MSTSTSCDAGCVDPSSAGKSSRSSRPTYAATGFGIARMVDMVIENEEDVETERTGGDGSPTSTGDELDGVLIDAHGRMEMERKWGGNARKGKGREGKERW